LYTIILINATVLQIFLNKSSNYVDEMLQLTATNQTISRTHMRPFSEANMRKS